jgi:hypothetical protein
VHIALTHSLRELESGERISGSIRFRLGGFAVRTCE